MEEALILLPTIPPGIELISHRTPDNTTFVTFYQEGSQALKVNVKGFDSSKFNSSYAFALTLSSHSLLLGTVLTIP